MAVITNAQARAYAAAAGFTGGSIDTIVAIAMAESGLDPAARQFNLNGSIDRGILQINSRAWRSIDDQTAYDPAAAFRAAYMTISKQGHDFSGWAAYRDGSYVQFLPHLDHLPTNAGAGPAAAAKWSYQDSLNTWPWLNLNNVTQRYGQNGETGVDIAIQPYDTPITSLTYGTVLATGYYGGGGVVSVQSNIPGMGVQSLYYQHLDDIFVAKGDIVTVGQTIGLSGGQLTGGKHPSQPEFSTGPHVEIGLNAPYGSFWAPIGPNVDPLPFLTQLIQQGPSAHDTVASANVPGVGAVIAGGQFANGAGPIANTFSELCYRIDVGMSWQAADLARGISPADILPWNWGSAGQTIGGNALGAMTHNAGALAARAVCVLIGFAIIVALIFHLLFAGLRRAADSPAGHAAETAAPVVIAAAV